MEFCKTCGERSVIADLNTDFRVCSACGVEQSCDVFQTQTFDSNGRPLLSIVREDFSYREAKIYRATSLISDIVARLALPDAREAEITRMVFDVTDGEYGGGNWFSILVVACAYIVMRKNQHPLPMAEAAASVGSGVHEVGRMVNRVREHLELDPLPEFDMAQLLERTLRSCPCLSRVDKDTADEMLKQGKFLLQCSVRWFLTTGRQPLPLVAAVLAFVADVNGVAVTIEEIAKETHAGVATSKRRKKELVETLMKASKALLPWGEDVTARNIAHNASLLLRYMELKSKSGSFDLGTFGVRFHDLPNEKESLYFEPRNRDVALDLKKEGSENFKLSSCGLSNAYKNAIQHCNHVKTAMSFENNTRKKTKLDGMVIDARMSELTKRGPTLDQILDMNVGYDAPPPSYVTGLEAVQKRRKKIKAAKFRIAEIMSPRPNSTRKVENTSFAIEGISKRKHQKLSSEASGYVDWEDNIIEVLVLRGVKEEEIEQGHYKRLLDLHMFNGLENK